MAATVSLFLCGDVMLARGVDMIHESHCNPRLYEGNGLTAHGYVDLAIKANGPIPPRSQRKVDYVWGDAITVLEEKKPDLRIINLETSITTNDIPWPDKGIHYRMHPKNVAVIKSASIDCCVLSNNHTADWGFQGLKETLETLRESHIPYAGAGFNLDEAQAPAVFPIKNSSSRVLVFAAGHWSSGVPNQWRASSKHEGVHILDIHNVKKATAQLKELVRKYRQPDDVIILSIHWGGNWGFEINQFQKDFAHAAIEECGIDVVHGHSSHHVQGVEVFRGRLIIYGCGDFINDYEGIGGHSEYRGDLALMYFVEVEVGRGHLRDLTMVPTQMAKLRVNLAQGEDLRWLSQTMDRECQKYGLSVVTTEKGELKLKFEGAYSTRL